MQQIITFRHPYHKLDLPEFTTIRGKTFFSKFEIEESVLIKTPSASFSAIVVDIQLLKIRDIPFETLRIDTNYGRHSISNRSDFLKLINSFRTGHMPIANEDSTVTLLTLRK